MLATLLFYILITITCLWTGYLFHCFFLGKSWKEQDRQPRKGAVVLAVWGMIVLSGVGQFAALLIPVNWLCWLGWVMLLGIVSLTRRNVFFLFTDWLQNWLYQHRHLLLPGCVIMLVVGMLGAGPLMMDDTDSYHIQCIKWIQEWGTVPGLVNLHERYGFNSAWFAFAALFTPLQTAHNYYTLSNGVLSIWISGYLVSLAFPAQGRAKSPTHALFIACFFVLLMALFCWPMIRGNAATANYDFVTTCLILVGWIELMKLEKDGAHWSRFLPEMLVWPAYLFSVRIINFPLLLLSSPGMIYLVRHRKYYSCIVSLLLAAALVVPFLIRNVLLSGFLFYPAYQVDLFSVDWKADLTQTKEIVDYIKYFNRINNVYLPIRETAKLSFAEWVPLWFRYLSWTDKLVVLVGLTGYGWWIMRQKAHNLLRQAGQAFAAVMLVQLVSWFWVAPDPRFVYGPLLVGVFLLFYALPFRRTHVHYQKWQKFLQGGLLLGLLAYASLRVVSQKEYRQLFQPVPLPQPATQVVWIDSIRLQIPKKIGTNWNARCYATDLPCLYKVHPRLHARGKGIGAGFTVRKQVP
ncbi:MAG: hypothetical protein INR73_18305 [Williamsia sp.]|nr:hypothetical protein [Williamsia sp.]